MKKIIRVAALAVIATLCGVFVANGQKFGSIDSNLLIQSMPEMDSVQTKLTVLNKELEETYETMTVEFNKKVNDYAESMTTLSDATRRIREDEVQKLRERIQEFEYIAQQEMEAEQNKLMAPVVEKARKAIAKIGKDNGFTFILDLSRGPVVYQDEKLVIDILPLVKTELGIK